MQTQCMQEGRQSFHKDKDGESKDAEHKEDYVGSNNSNPTFWT
jgi:hypothetical protein